MDIYFQLIRDAEDLKKAVSELSSHPFLGFDTETTDLDPFKGELRLVQFSTGKSSYIIDLRPFGSNGGLRSNPDLASLRKLITAESPIKIAHNAKFDAKWVRHHLGCELGGTFDTYLASQLLAAGDTERRHSLADAAQYFIGIEVDKSQQMSDWGAADLSQTQLEYAARDAAILLPLQSEIARRLKDDGLEKAAKLEFDCIVPIAEMELNGMFLDTVLWNDQLEKVKVQQLAVSDELQEMLSAGVAQASLFGRTEINLDSQQQVNNALRNIGIPLPENARAWHFQSLMNEYPVVSKLVDYRHAQKLITSFGSNILEFVEPSTGRVHADFRQIGAPTGRFSCSNPNLQQIPHESAYRRCFRAESGRKLVIADYSQIELRILAAFSGDRAFIKAFESGRDFHTMTASQVFNVDAASVSPEQRSFAKRLNFGVVYGIGASRFASMTGISQKDAENTLQKYFSTYSSLDSYLRESAARVITDRIARTASDRMIRLRFDENDRQSIASAKRYGVNMPIQGTSADILKRALRLLHDSLQGTSGRLVNIVHDEIVVECEEADADATADLLRKAMTQAGREFVNGVPVEADVHVSDDWTK